MRTLILLSVIGLSGCVETVSDSAVCAGLKPSVAQLRGALERHPETPQAVGEAGTRVVLLTEAGCR